jgi:hypothetical protein
MGGFEPVWMPSWLFDFQTSLVDWAVRKGKAALFCDCGMGKTPMQLVWAQNVCEHTNRRVLILTPLAVGPQTVAEGDKFHIQCVRSKDGRLRAGANIIVTNYERLHLFNPDDFAGVVCDESSILKHFTGATQKQVTRFLLKVPYRLLCTATAAPNDYIELGTSSEALGELGYSDMLARFFKQDDKKPHRLEQVKRDRAIREANYEAARNPNHFGKLSFRVSQQIGQWRLKGHAVTPFWRWVASWARACRKPSDLGFDDARFVLPPLVEREHVIIPRTPQAGQLFVVPAVGLKEERDERRRTLTERCQLVTDLVSHDKPAVVWCHLNVEGDALAQTIPHSRQVQGSDSDDAKEEAYRAFQAGDFQRLIIKPKIGAWGMNWQFCSHVVTFASHSYEQYYQVVRRCWRFGQTSPVTVDVISTEGEHHVRESMARKSEAASLMFTELVSHMQDATRVSRQRDDVARIEVPSWAS